MTATTAHRGDDALCKVFPVQSVERRVTQQHEALCPLPRRAARLEAHRLQRLLQPVGACSTKQRDYSHSAGNCHSAAPPQMVGTCSAGKHVQTIETAPGIAGLLGGTPINSFPAAIAHREASALSRLCIDSCRHRGCGPAPAAAGIHQSISMRRLDTQQLAAPQKRVFTAFHVRPPSCSSSSTLSKASGSSAPAAASAGGPPSPRSAQPGTAPDAQSASKASAALASCAPVSCSGCVRCWKPVRYFRSAPRYSLRRCED